ncbi:MAG: hypothetical protein PHN55_14945 [Dysgonamonadaceae bacterium]|nr:hypothetical protein [Dysgonamonadaceae bacterium]
METEIPTEIMILAYLVIILVILSFIFFTYYSIKIYVKSYTLKSFAKLLFSYLLLISIDLIFRPSLSFVTFLDVVSGYFAVFTVFMVVFYLLRIEERDFDFKYTVGFFISLIIYLVLSIYNASSNSQFSLVNSFYINMFILLIFLFLIYTLKVLYNITMKKEKIKYPIIFFGLLISILLIGTAINGFYKTLNLIYSLIQFILIFNIMFFYIWINEWLSFTSKEVDVNQNSKNSYFSKKISLYKDRFMNREISIEKSEYPLNDEVKNAITNSKCLDLDSRDLKQLQFMLVCASQVSETLNNESSFAQNTTFAGLTLMILPFIELLWSFFDYLMDFQMNLITTIPEFDNILDPLFSKLNNSTLMIIGIISMYLSIFIFAVFLSLVEPNSKTNYWIKKRRIINELYGLLPSIIFVSLVIKWIQTSEINLIDTALFFGGLMFYIIGILIITLNRKRLINANKIILDLNNKIIFYEK